MKLFHRTRDRLTYSVGTIEDRAAVKIAPARLPSFRRFIVKLHIDLFMIDRRVKRHAEHLGPLSMFEKLIVALEDRRFFVHRGFDWIASAREVLKAVTFRRFGGASTIDMQFVRTATGFRELTVRRKLYEMLLAWLIQFRYSKIVILRSYLDCAFFGSHLYGIKKAAHIVYNKQPLNLVDAEAAELAAMLVYPRPLRPSNEWMSRVQRRASYGLHWVRRLEKSFDKIPRGE